MRAVANTAGKASVGERGRAEARSEAETRREAVEVVPGTGSEVIFGLRDPIY
jgi:hypothetical protein